MIKERPILMSTPMVQAILKGKKTQTRRIVKPQPWYVETDGSPLIRKQGHRLVAVTKRNCPYGQPGDRLWCITIKPIKGYEDRYGAGDDGNIYRLPIPKKMKAGYTQKGYANIQLSKQGETKTCLVHRLVCEAFYGEPPQGFYEVRHLDSNPKNNCPDNLDWTNSPGNWVDRSAMGRGVREKHWCAKLSNVEIGEIRQSGLSQRQLAKKYKVSQATIWSILNKVTWQPLPRQAKPNMPRWASRILLEVVDIRVERAQDITAIDAIAEGLRKDKGWYSNYVLGNRKFYYHKWENVPGSDGHVVKYHGEFLATQYAITSFATLWDSINAERGYGWNKNNWVWVIIFKLLKKG